MLLVQRDFDTTWVINCNDPDFDINLNDTYRSVQGNFRNEMELCGLRVLKFLFYLKGRKKKKKDFERIIYALYAMKIMERKE